MLFSVFLGLPFGKTTWNAKPMQLFKEKICSLKYSLTDLMLCHLRKSISCVEMLCVDQEADIMEKLTSGTLNTGGGLNS